MSDIKLISQKRYWGGILALSGVIFIWVASSFAMNNYASIPSSTSIPQQQEKLSTIETIKLSLTFCILWFFANFTTNASLAYTTVGSSTILSSMSGLFTLGIGALFNVEKLNMIKFMAVLISFTGVILVSYSDHVSDSLPYATSPLIGDILALLGAVFYGCYTILLKLKIGSEDRIDMTLFFGFVGAFNILLLWPVLPLLDYFGLETFEIPTNSTLWIVIFLNAFIGTFLSDYLWLLSMLMTSPLVVTLGISLTTPLALMGDVLFKGIIPNIQYSIGALLVVAGFLAVNTNALKEAKIKSQEEILENSQL
ncbi:hypothetical protein G6F21_006915 [Rhizopus arrhizus]|nr:hypothetical protein G6F21_006915 [Rhizopus arrhizus]KAG0945113.1 hypothetical protein G6F32_007061 [Rhizopus arrhizus]KAG1015110.1 hypothetical protein G6F27_000345 [Rhizopus arrhizus]KAG1068327.1 hypothetical protein G6F41_006940 [Rhizopus arrhizus]KAG1094335.1 hypothetical protein G6F39_008124 [Rhizopus arrhizus]